MKIGILGCGVISNTYIQEIKRLYSSLMQIVAVADLDMERVRQTAEKFEIEHAYTVEELLADPETELIINLTPPFAHTEMNRKILMAGKHVFCEKPFALTVEDAQDTLRLAEEKGLRVGSAPDTFLTSSMQSSRKVLEDGWVGKPMYVTANMMSCGMELWHPNPTAFYQKGGGPLYDMAPYYLSVLVHFFGPIQEVFSYGAKGYEQRKVYTGPKKGSMVDVTVPTHYAAVLKMKNGILVNMNMSFDIWHSTLPKMEVYGTEGTLLVPDPNMSDGRAAVLRKEQVVAKAFNMPEDMHTYEVPQRVQNVSEYTRGTGVAEMVVSIKEGRKHRANGEMATHIIEAITGMMESAETGICYQMKTSCEQPAMWNWTEECL